MLKLALTAALTAVAAAAPAVPRRVAEDSTCDGAVLKVQADSAEALDAALAQAASVWRVAGNTAHINVRTGQVAAVQSIPGLNVTVTIPDLEGLVRDQKAKRFGNWSLAASQAVRGAKADPFFDEYRELEVIHLYMEALHAEHPAITTFIPSIGESYEGRPIPALLVGGEDGGQAVFLQGTVHAREWISPSTVMFLAVELLETTDPGMLELRNFLKFVFVPVQNPDGYVHSFTEGGRQWRKSRNTNEGFPDCPGTDLNRNWGDGARWGGPGASEDPCSGLYRGAHEWSEPECSAVRDYVKQFVGPDTGRRHPFHIEGAVDYHSFGQIFLRPYAWASTTTDPPPNNEAMIAIAEKMVVAASETPLGVPYTQGGWHDELYPSSGVFGDWIYSVIEDGAGPGDGKVLTAELRDLGELGFVLPDSEIRPVGEEQLAALYELGRGIIGF